MTDKELKKLSRAELLEMLLAQSREVETLREQLTKANKILEDRRITIDNAGSIAEASLQLNGVFQAAQNAVAQYIENMQRQEELCTQMKRKSRDEAEKMLSDAKIKCSAMENETREKCDIIVKSAQEQAQKYWDDVSTRVARLAKAGAGSKGLSADSGIERK